MDGWTIGTDVATMLTGLSVLTATIVWIIITSEGATVASTVTYRLNIGLAQLGIGQYRDAADALKSGIEDMPADQCGAEWMNEYRQALAYASERA
jgi:hypothetical protein